MKQMVAPSAPVVKRMRFGDVGYGFMRNYRGEIFFLRPWGNETLAFPLNEDGTLTENADLSFNDNPWAVVDLVHWRDIGLDLDKFVKTYFPGTPQQ